MGNSIALYNPPTRVAEEFAMIDVISGGRLIAGFPSARRWTIATVMARTRRCCASATWRRTICITRAWKDQDTFAFNGRFNQQRYVNIWPRPISSRIRRSGFPVAGRRDLAVVRGDGLCVLLSVLFRLQGRQGNDEGLLDEMARLGKDRNPNRAGFLQFVGVAETREKAYELYKPAAEYFYGAACTRIRVGPRRRVISRKRLNARHCQPGGPRLGD